MYIERGRQECVREKNGQFVELPQAQVTPNSAHHQWLQQSPGSIVSVGTTEHLQVGQVPMVLYAHLLSHVDTSAIYMTVPTHMHLCEGLMH